MGRTELNMKEMLRLIKDGVRKVREALANGDLKAAETVYSEDIAHTIQDEAWDPSRYNDNVKTRMEAIDRAADGVWGSLYNLQEMKGARKKLQDEAEETLTAIVKAVNDCQEALSSR